ncbi:MAG: sigma-70 family RNA polymerase sigma factor [Alcaligenaceae bacterium]|nr:sigma-70 family RNA polymerase sigma factor [Alcaligenaceae bacterium SAGV5]MPS52466.1 sigma-70 family RNA polymerase sigma factor [Alcaligenaceae bacterium SAGV3]MPT57530.1 sigma-70 family RNA polymerase sigma factor [Alcaligenaceae bacterium]
MPDLPDVTFDYEAALSACAAGRHEALERLYRQESPRLLGVARRIVGDTALAEDVVHDAFVNIWKEARRFDPQRGSARGWIYSITRHLALNFVRDHARVVVPSEAESARLETDAAMAQWQDARRSPDWSDHVARMQPCLDALPADRQSCIVYAYLDGLTHAEIAERMDTPLGTIKAWISRSLKALKECLS